MKVKELIKRLETVDPEAAVIFWGDSYPIELRISDVTVYTDLNYIAENGKPMSEREFVMGNAVNIGG